MARREIFYFTNPDLLSIIIRSVVFLEYEMDARIARKDKNLSRLEVFKVLKVALTIVYVLICLALVVVVLGQESKSEGFSGSISGMAETYWGKNKGRSMEGTMERITKILAAAFLVLSVVLNLL